MEGGGEKKQVSPSSHPRQRPHIDAVFGRAPTHVVKDEGHRGVVGDQEVGTHESNNCRCAAEANQADEQCDRHADGDGLPGVLRLFPCTIVDCVSSIHLPKLLVLRLFPWTIVDCVSSIHLPKLLVLRLFPWTIVDCVSSIHLPKLLWVCCLGHAGVKRKDRVGTLAGKATLTRGLLFSRKV